MIILRINYSDFVLPEDTNVNALLDVLKPLAKGHVDKEYSEHRKGAIYIRNPVEIELKIVDEATVMDERPVAKLEPAPTMPADEDIGRVAPVQDPHANIGVDNF